MILLIGCAVTDWAWRSAA